MRPHLGQGQKERRNFGAEKALTNFHEGKGGKEGGGADS